MQSVKTRAAGAAERAVPLLTVPEGSLAGAALK
jgi:hypothetical protein